MRRASGRPHGRLPTPPSTHLEPMRRRDAAATRAAVQPGCRAFARSRYDSAGVREIAAGAGVTAMLVNSGTSSQMNSSSRRRSPSRCHHERSGSGEHEAGCFGRSNRRALIGITKHGDAPLEGVPDHAALGIGRACGRNRSRAVRAPPSKKCRGLFERGARAPT